MRVNETLALVALGLGLALSVWVPLTDGDGASAEAYVTALRTLSPSPRDTVVIQPPWRDDVLRAADEAGLPFAVTLAVSKKSVEPLRNLIVVHDDAFPLPRAWRRVAEPVSDHGPVRVVRLSQGRDAGGPRLLSGIERAAVVVVDAAGQETACRWDAAQKKHTCAPHPDWVWVGEKDVTSGETSRRCFWSHPVSGGHVRTTFKGVDPAQTLSLGAAFQQSALRKRDGASVVVEATVGGTRVARIRHRNEAGFRTTALDLSAYKQPVDLVVDVTTADDGMRHFCFTLDVTE